MPSSGLKCAYLRLYGFSDGTNLVDFQEQAIAGSRLCSFLYPLWVGHCQVVPYNLDPNLSSQTGPCIPVILVKRILD